MSGRKCNVEVFSRVTGFFRPVQSWNKGKTAEFKDRKKFNLNMSTPSVDQQQAETQQTTEKKDDSRTAETVTG